VINKCAIFLASFLMIMSCPYYVIAINRTVSYQNVKSLGMGDTKVAGGFNYNGFVDNPALLYRIRITRFSIINSPIIINNNLFDIANYVNYNVNNIKNFRDFSDEGKRIFLDSMRKYEGNWGHINISPMYNFAYSHRSHSIGIALFEIRELGIKLGTDNFEPQVWGKGFSRRVFMVGFARPVSLLNRDLICGVNFKYIERRRTDLFLIKAGDLGNLQETIDPILDKFKLKKRTYAIDLGALWRINPIQAQIGTAVQSIGDGRGVSFNIGISKRMLSNCVTLLADYIDLLDNNRENIFDKIHLGAEFSYDVFALRTGLNAGYPTIGFGMNYKLVHFDFAYFTSELNNIQSNYKDKRMAAQVKLGW